MFMPINNELPVLHKLADLSNFSETLGEYLSKCDIQSLELLQQETNHDIEDIIIHLSDKQFKRLIKKLKFSKKDKKNITINKMEKFVSFISTLLGIMLPSAGVALMTLGTNIWLMISAIAITSMMSIISGFSGLYSSSNESNTLVVKKKIINLKIELAKELIKKKFIASAQKLAQTLSSFKEKNNPENGSSMPVEDQEPLIINGTPNEIITNLLSNLANHSLSPTIERMNIKQELFQYQSCVRNSKISLGFDQNYILNCEKIDDSLECHRLTFNKWWKAHKGEIIKEAVLGDKGAAKAISIFTLGGFALGFAKAAGIVAITGFLAGPIGLPVLIGTALLCTIAIASISIYIQYRNANRKYELQLAENVLNEHKNTISQIDQLDKITDKIIDKRDSVVPRIENLTTEIKEERNEVHEIKEMITRDRSYLTKKRSTGEIALSTYRDKYEKDTVQFGRTKKAVSEIFRPCVDKEESAGLNPERLDKEVINSIKQPYIKIKN
jgi:membrane protein implicated in regulation of membrane protease activity